MVVCGQRGIGALAVLIGLLLIGALSAAYFWAHPARSPDE